MSSDEYIQISAFLRPDQIKELDRIARQKGIHGRQPLLRWAVDHYLAFLLADVSTYRSEQHVDRPDTTDVPA